MAFGTYKFPFGGNRTCLGSRSPQRQRPCWRHRQSSSNGLENTPPSWSEPTLKIERFHHSPLSSDKRRSAVSSVFAAVTSSPHPWKASGWRSSAQNYGTHGSQERSTRAGAAALAARRPNRRSVSRRGGCRRCCRRSPFGSFDVRLASSVPALHGASSPDFLDITASIAPAGGCEATPQPVQTSFLCRPPPVSRRGSRLPLHLPLSLQFWRLEHSRDLR